MNTQVKINDRLGELIRQTRRRLGWTLEGFLARMLAAGGPAPSMATLSRVERGFATFSVPEAACACRVLGISFHVLQQSLRIQRIGPLTPVPGDLLIQRGPELYAIGAHEELLGNLEAAYDDLCLCHNEGASAGDPALRLNVAEQLSFLHRRFLNWDLARHFARVILSTPGVDDVQRIRAHASLMATDAAEGRWAEYSLRRIAVEARVYELEGASQAYVAMCIGANERRRGAFAAGRRWLEFALPIYAELKNVNALRGHVTLGECLIHTGLESAGLDLIAAVRHEALERGYLHTAWFAADALSRLRRTA